MILIVAGARAVAFQHALASTAASATCSRRTENLILRQGGSTSVETTVSLVAPKGACIELTDLTPPGGSVIQGDTTWRTTGTGYPDRSTLRYRLAYFATGELLFGGITIAVKDPFFSARVHLSGDSFRRPAVFVEPLNQFSGKSGLEGTGERELERITPLKGYGIRAFRLYRDGDDPRAIDWKLTAKHGKTYVREYAGLAGAPPLLVIDLPGPGQEGNPAAFDQILGAVNDAIIRGGVYDNSCGLLLISGPNLIKFVPAERSTLHARRLIDEAGRMPRVYSSFRSLEPSSARGMQVKIAQERTELTGGNGPGGVDDHLLRLSEVYRGFLPGMRTPTFDLQVRNVMRARKNSAVYVFSLYQGDLSHLRSLVLQSRQAGCETVLQVPSALPDGGGSGELTMIRGVDTVVIK
nr:DUF58 domain-containing protein [Methanolinea mesophila]